MKILTRTIFWIGWQIVVGMLGGCAVGTPPQVQQVEFGGTIWGEWQRRVGVIFQDGAQSFPVAGGALWTFGDTFMGKPQPDSPPQNSQITGAQWATTAFLPNGKTTLPPALEYIVDANGVATCPLALFPEEDQKHSRLWPSDGISIGAHVYLYYSMIATADAPGPWNFSVVGAGLAVADQPGKTFTRLRPGGDWRFPVNPIEIVRDGEALYLFEVSKEPPGLLLARVGAGQIEDPAAYEFFAGDHWSKKRTDAQVILREVYGQVSIAWVSALQKYVMATSSDFSHPREIQLRQSTQLEGPWGEPVRIAVPEISGKKTSLVYCTFLHPELSGADSMRQVATFCRLLDGSWQLSNPEWVVITLGPEQGR